MARMSDRSVEQGTIREEDFAVLLARAFATYGLSVVTDRALPDARDGLKPVQRRILTGMREAGYRSDRPTVKSAEVVGLILGNYHPHGDASVYEAAVRLAQPFTMRYPLIEGQGNMGSEDGDAPAAYRYTEMRLSPLAEALMADLECETVPLHPTYKQDPKVLEPDYLPGRLPPVINPSSGIAVGLATNIPPHNLAEVLRACIALLDQPEMSVEQLMAIIQGPDFSQGGRVIGLDGIRDYFTTGKGRIVIRAEVRLEETPRSRSLVVVQIPPVGRDRVKVSIAEAINAGRVEGLLPDVRDESDAEKGTRIVLDLRRDADPARVLTQLYQETDLQVSLSFQMVFLFGEPMQPARQPRQVGMLELLNYWNAHQIDVLTRRAQFQLRKARERLHVLEGLIIGAANAQEIVRLFQQAEDRAAARRAIEERYQLTAAQSEVIAGMTLSQVTRLDAQKYIREREELQARVAELEHLLNDRRALVTQLKREMQQLIRRFGDGRRTVVDAQARVDEPVREVLPLYERTPLTLVLTRAAAVKALPPGTYGARSTERYGPVRGDEQLRQILPGYSQDAVLCVASSGRVFQVPAFRLPQATRSARGEPLARLLALNPEEEPVALFALAAHEEDRYLVTFSRQGKVKKSPLSEYRTVDEEGLQDMKLAEGDAVAAALVVRAGGEYLVSSDSGQTLRFADESLRSQGRGGQGVMAMTLAAGSRLVSAACLQPEQPGGVSTEIALLLLSEQGYAKRLALEELPLRGRATAGVASLTLVPGDQLLTTLLVQPTDQLLFVWRPEGANRGEQTRVLYAQEIPLLGRSGPAQRLVEGQLLAAVLLPSVQES
ncbi:DNA gyrase/topoisomerase IV subunit A [Thermogemmatispora carboxidivorans]|uniref:DNA gyrase/topoisomerase IV subunit A n=1 Tax=Thermogemmatispora carboxidivorans TaxID=1382306 RepID=UPI000699B97B|nr:DNA gyrase subunit A [Thermogemmatispora carboxidivorans]